MKIVDIHNHIDTLNSVLRFRGKLQNHLVHLKDYLNENTQVVLSVSLYTYRNYGYLIELIKYIEREINQLGSDVTLIKEKADLNKHFKLGILLHVESARLLKDFQNQIPELFELGVRGIIPIHFVDNHLGNSSDDPLRRLSLKRRDEGITKKGENFVEVCNKTGLWLDLTHTTDKAADDILALGNHVMVSHIGLRDLINIQRNKPLELLKRVADSGGLVGLSPWKHLVGDDYRGHYEKACNHGLSGAVCIGSDFGVPIKTDNAFSTIFNIAKEISDEAFLQSNALEFFSKALPS